VYVNNRAKEIRFVELLADGAEADVEVVNSLRRNPTRIEYYSRNSALEVLDWSDSPAALHAECEIARTIELARELDLEAAAEEADDDFSSGAQWS